MLHEGALPLQMGARWRYRTDAFIPISDSGSLDLYGSSISIDLDISISKFNFAGLSREEPGFLQECTVSCVRILAPSCQRPNADRIMKFYNISAAR